MIYIMSKEDEFEDGFNNWMSSALQYEHCKRNNIPISDELQERMNSSGNWIENLSDDEYDRLIH